MGTLKACSMAPFGTALSYAIEKCPLFTDFYLKIILFPNLPSPPKDLKLAYMESCTELGGLVETIPGIFTCPIELSCLPIGREETQNGVRQFLDNGCCS